MSQIRADGRYALRRWEVNDEWAAEWARDAEVAAAAGRADEVARARWALCICRGGRGVQEPATIAAWLLRATNAVREVALARA